MSKIFSVSNSEDLMNALASATGGDIIELAGGDYGQLDLITTKTFGVKAIYDSPVTITSADPDAQAIFSGINLKEVENLTFDNVTFESNYTGESTWVSPFTVLGSSNITFRDSVFQGKLATSGDEGVLGYATGYGLKIGSSTGVTVENNEFSTWHKGLIIGGSTDISVTGNDMHSISGDAMNFSGVTSILIENNHIHDFNISEKSTTHSDMIQFWTRNTTSPSTDITIKGNILDSGEGQPTQSIFMRNDVVDQGLAGEEMFYQNILIENNTIYNAHTHGITVGETNGLTILNNTVLRVGSDYDSAIASVTVPKINVKPTSTSVTIDGNVTSAINGYAEKANWAVDSNVLIQPVDYLTHFITSSLATKTGEHNFIVLPDGLVETLQAGAAQTQFDATPDTLTPYFQVYSNETSGQTLILDASLTVGPLGLVLESDAEFQWTFGDGNTATGRIVEHNFTSPGHHDVTLTVVAKDGTTAQAQFTAGIAGEGIVQFDAEAGRFEALAYGEETALDGSGLTLQANAEGYALKLGGEGNKASVASSELTRFFGTDSFEMSMSLKADSADSWGEVARIHTSLTASVDGNGNFVLDLFPEGSSRVTMVSTGISLTDGAVHDVTVRFDGQAGFAEILIDGQMAASKSISGILGGDARSLMFGNPWGKKNFDGELSDFMLSADTRDFPIYDGAVQPVLETATPTTEKDTTTTSPDVVEVDDETVPKDDTVVDSGEVLETATPTTEKDTTTTSPDVVEVDDETVPKDDTVVDSGETVTSEPTETKDTTNSSASDPALTEPVEEPSTEEESSLPEPLLNGGYQLDFASVAISNTVQLHDNAHLVETEDGPAVSFDGKKDFVSLGRLTEFEASQKLAFSVDFVSDNTNGGSERLVWNHLKLGLTLEGDGLRIHAQNNDGKFHEGFQVDGLGLNDGNLHNATVMVDAGTDRLQVVVNDVLVLDEQGTDFDFVGAGGHEWGWSLGTAWNRWFEGEVHEFQVSDDFEFIDPNITDSMLTA